MKKIKLPFKLRLSITADCNYHCVYCPYNTTKENFTPYRYNHIDISTNEYCKLLSKLNGIYSFSAISITGGEPFMSKDIEKIVKTIYEKNTSIELNTNGSVVSKEQWKSISPYIRQARISFDAYDRKIYNEMTGIKQESEIQDKVFDFIEMTKGTSTDIILNCVITKKNLSEIPKLIDFAEKEDVRLSLLDLYYTKETNKFWKEYFIPIESLHQMLENRIGRSKKRGDFGCVFHSYFGKHGKEIVRTKSSFKGTMRKNKCNYCDEYCQEGIYALKMSRQGWVTTCPSESEEKGVFISPLMSKEKIKATIKQTIEEFKDTVLDKKSFYKMLAFYGFSIKKYDKKR